MKKLIIGIMLFFSYWQSFAFSDIGNNWYKESILELKWMWVINGYENDTFLPYNTTTRAEILKIIMNSANIEVIDPEEQCFFDVDTNLWYAKYVCSGVEKEITNGYSDGSFQPNGTITVIETLAFAARAFDLGVESLNEGQEWYEKYIAFAHVNNIFPKHSYTVNTLISRGQASELINRVRKFAQNEYLDYKSSGCSVNPELTSGSYTIEAGGLMRQYLLYVPSGMKKDKEMSLTIAFHGRTNSNEMVRDYMQLGGGRYGYKQNDFIVAYPAGMGAGPYSWSQFENIEMFDAIITKVSEELCVNRDKVFSVGHSLGSYMSNKVSCQRGDVIRAMTGVASAGFNGECTGPVSSLITHLAGDPLASYSSGLSAYQIRSTKNLCGEDETSMNIWDIRSCSQRNSCTTGNTTIFCNSYATYGNDQHSWPKDGSDDILDFFRDIEEYSK